MHSRKSSGVCESGAILMLNAVVSREYEKRAGVA